jgi:hypothetical protein
MSDLGRSFESVIDVFSAGPELDREVARRVLGRTSLRHLPAYSTDDLAATRLREILEKRRSLECTFEQDEGIWYCICWASSAGGRRERVSTGSGNNRALAFCRAAFNLPRRVSAAEQARWGKRQIARACEKCGSEERMRGRALAVRFCNVCAWRLGKLGMLEPG